MKCIYHSRDLDGWMSAAIVKRKYPDVELIGWDYGVPYPDWEKDIDGHKVVMVDVSFPKTTMLQYMNYNDLIWLDHHISAINDMGDIEDEIKGMRDPELAACELTWNYFFPEYQMPELVRLLGRYDCFGHKGTPEEETVLQFQYAARAQISNVDEAYKALAVMSNYDEDEYIEEWLKVGRGIYAYLCVEAKQIYARRFTLRFGEYFFAAVNQERFNPINFGINYHNDSANDNYYYDGFCCFALTRGKWTFSLYNDNGQVDCSVICKSMGGGGHKGAAGFVVEDLNQFLSIHKA